MENQITIFEMVYPTYKITKPIRLIEFFAGYGSQALALKYLGVPFEHWKICEWAVKSIQAYKDIHFTDDNFDYSWCYKNKEDIVDYLYEQGISSNYNEPMTKQQISRLNEKQLRTIYNNIRATHNLVNIQTICGEDLEIVDTNKYDYILTYSFPCQDLSLAGKGKGMSDTSTRSGMLWEVERILTECHELGTMPQILLMENVPQVHGTDNVEDFNKWQLRLEELGYKNYWQDLIATDYGIPQTRNRCFMVSILGNYNYTFPKPIPLKLKLKDLLEDNVDEKYYLKDYQIENIKKSTYCQNQRRIQSEEVCDTLCARDWKDPKCVIRKNKIDIKQKVKIRKYEVNIDKLKKILKEHKKYSNKEISSKLNIPLTTVEHWFRNDKSFSVPDANIWFKLKKLLNIKTNEFDESITRFIEKDNLYEKNNRCYFDDGLAPTLTATSSDEKIISNLRIRKLTPRECFRLMGVKDEDFDKVKKNHSDSSLYHLAGDSIVVNVLMAIFEKLT